MRIEKQDTEDDLLIDLYLPAILTGEYGDPDSPESILEKLKTVDGDGSGLDADMLDGKHSDDFILKKISLAGHMIVIAEDGEIADGGTLEEFKNEFNNNTSDSFK